MGDVGKSKEGQGANLIVENLLYHPVDLGGWWKYSPVSLLSLFPALSNSLERFNLSS